MPENRGPAILLLILAVLIASPFYSDSANRFASSFQAELTCGLSGTSDCTKAALGLVGSNPRLSARLLQTHLLNRSCINGGQLPACQSAARHFLQLKRKDLAVDAWLAGCQLGDAESCSSAAATAAEATLASFGFDSGVDDKGLTAAHTACEKNDADGCLYAATFYLLHDDLKAEYSVLYKGCYQLHSEAACVRYAQDLFYQDHLPQATHALLSTCEGRPANGCERLFPDLTEVRDPFLSWQKAFARLDGVWSETISDAYYHLARSKARAPASEQGRVITQNLSSLVVPLKTLSAWLRLLPPSARFSTRQAVQAYVASMLRLTGDAKRLLESEADKAALATFQKEINDASKAHAQAIAQLRQAGLVR